MKYPLILTEESIKRFPSLSLEGFHQPLRWRGTGFAEGDDLLICHHIPANQNHNASGTLVVKGNLARRADILV